MGCNNSKEDTAHATEVVSSRAPPSRRKSNGPLTPQEIEQRIDSCDVVKELNFEDFSMKYAYVCQRGYYPDCKIL